MQTIQSLSSLSLKVLSSLQHQPPQFIFHQGHHLCNFQARMNTMDKFWISLFLLNLSFYSSHAYLDHELTSIEISFLQKFKLGT